MLLVKTGSGEWGVGSDIFSRIISMFSTLRVRGRLRRETLRQRPSGSPVPYGGKPSGRTGLTVSPLPIAHSLLPV